MASRSSVFASSSPKINQTSDVYIYVDNSGVDLAALRRRIDWHIMPIMFLCYTIQLLDKVVLNYADAMGLSADLHLTRNDFSNVSTAVFIAYIIAEVPNGFILQKVPLANWLGFNVMAWGIATSCIAGTTNYTTLLLARIFMGIFESVTVPCLMLIGSQYYRRSEQFARFSFWFCGFGFAQIVGGLVSYAFQTIGPGTTVIAGWRIMFLVLGLGSVLTGLVTMWILPNMPMDAKWMTSVEKVGLMHHVSVNRTGFSNHHRFKASQAVQLLSDLQIWFLTMITILVSIPASFVVSYSSTMISALYTPKIAALLIMPSGVVSILSVVAVSYGFRHVSHCSVWLNLCCGLGALGSSLLMVVSGRAASLVGIYLVNITTVPVIILYQWTMANVAGHTKRAIASTLIPAGVAIGNIIGHQTFQARDVPVYQFEAFVLFMAQCGAALLTVFLLSYYLLANLKKRGRLLTFLHRGLQMDLRENTWGNLTDTENLEFTYVR